jgi:hypothetical protein
MRLRGWLVVSAGGGKGKTQSFTVKLLGEDVYDVTSTVARVAAARQVGFNYRWPRTENIATEVIETFLSNLCQEPWMTAVQAAGMNPGEFESLLLSRCVAVP